jgi:hypothetical protein
VGEPPFAGLVGGLDPVAQHRVGGVEHDVEGIQLGRAQLGEDLVEVVALQHGLRDDDVLAGHAADLDERGGDERPPGRPVLEVADRAVDEDAAEHLAHGLRVENATAGNHGREPLSRGGFTDAKGPVQPDNHPDNCRGANARAHASCCRR